MCVCTDQKDDQVVIQNRKTKKEAIKLENWIDKISQLNVWTAFLDSNGPCNRSFSIQPSFGQELGEQQMGLEALNKLERENLSTPISALRPDNRDDSIDGDGPNTQDYFLQKLLKREQEILDFLDSTNEKIKQKIKDSSDYTDSLRYCL